MLKDACARPSSWQLKVLDEYPSKLILIPCLSAMHCLVSIAVDVGQYTSYLSFHVCVF